MITENQMWLKDLPESVFEDIKTQIWWYSVGLLKYQNLTANMKSKTVTWLIKKLRVKKRRNPKLGSNRRNTLRGQMTIMKIFLDWGKSWKPI